MKNMFLIVCCVSAFALAARETVVFGKVEPEGDKWRLTGTLPGIEPTRFALVENPERPGCPRLVVTAHCSTGMIVTKPKVDLRRTPVMRWRWRVVRPFCLTENEEEPDDQALAVYIGDKKSIHQRSVSYRWEVLSPVGREYLMYYMLKTSRVHAFVLRNHKEQAGRWVTEERNVFEDFHRMFNADIQNEFALLIGANSQHIEQTTVAEIDYIEFLSEAEAAADPIPECER